MKWVLLLENKKGTPLSRLFMYVKINLSGRPPSCDKSYDHFSENQTDIDLHTKTRNTLPSFFYSLFFYF